ncbi:MAG TPA: sugar kinase [Planctomycetota bacterium]|nr:sugar kinase [Planctomycetota bacterium]HRR81277.1 sugar kinase [Planctomycetota bacterium]HRT97804.1 sugar kinase [Planctomycetota bacterium]
MDVCCLGILVADAFGSPIDDIPPKGSLRLFDHMELHIGGCAANAGIAMAKLGLETSVIGKVGDDVFGHFVSKTLNDAGIDSRGVVVDPKASTSFTFVIVGADGQRRFLHTMGANATLCAADVNMEIVRQAKILHVAGTMVMPTFDGAQCAQVLQAARAAGVTTCMDTVFNDRLHDYMPVIGPCLPHLDMFLPSIEEAERVAGTSEPREIVRRLHERGVGIVAVKLGPKGSYVFGDGEEAYVPSYAVKAVDTSGAGDCWVAGFLLGRLRGWTLVESARFGNAVAAHCVQAFGCTAGVRDFEATRAFQRTARTIE